ncbi:hypothetical protein [Streptomyces sp. G1]|uniref:hypothetical protein n=1 Tax=Streptomyces sp. G1 TaxID=361572 RepID=UPI00202F9C0D|nr:hypothetical protein [Streptomyces sp. G1]MCM1964847.1 hypothetical protein [Streptomyces sp. G1]
MTARPREVTAAASRYTSRRIKAKPVDQSWQTRAWDHYGRVPEVAFVASFTSHAMTGVRLFAARRAADGTIEPAPDDHRASQLVASIAGGPDGQAQMMGDFGRHLTVAGEGWIIIRPDTDEEGNRVGEAWHVLSTDEVQAQGQRLTVEIDGFPVEIPGDDPEGELDPNAPAAIRVWQPHPRRRLEADSCVRSALDVLDELQLLTAAVSAIARSRLHGRGIVLIPKGARFPAHPAQGDAEDDLIDTLITVAETAYRDPESAAAIVPIFLEVPAETIAQIQRLTFESDFDELALKLREEAIRRFATGSDVPPEVLLGTGAANHWSAWSISEDAIRYGIEPKARTVAHALTTQWLRLLLDFEGVPDADEWLVWYDTAPLRVRANRAQTALEVYDRGGISAEALRRETGFDESDAPAPAAAQEETPLDDGEEDATPAELPAGETTGPPALQPVASAAPPVSSDGFLAAADGLIWSALSHAGERLRRTPLCPRSQRAEAAHVQPALLHTRYPADREQVDDLKLLDGAWARVPEIADRYGVEAECLQDQLHDYCRDLITAAVAHDFTHTRTLLRAPCLTSSGGGRG